MSKITRKLEQAQIRRDRRRRLAPYPSTITRMRVGLRYQRKLPWRKLSVEDRRLADLMTSNFYDMEPAKIAEDESVADANPRMLSVSFQKNGGKFEMVQEEFVSAESNPSPVPSLQKEEACSPMEDIANAMRSYADTFGALENPVEPKGGVFAYNFSVRGHVDENKDPIGRQVFSEQWTTSTPGDLELQGEQPTSDGEKAANKDATPSPARSHCGEFREKMRLLLLFAALLTLGALGFSTLFYYHGIHLLPREAPTSDQPTNDTVFKKMGDLEVNSIRAAKQLSECMKKLHLGVLPNIMVLQDEVQELQGKIDDNKVTRDELEGCRVELIQVRSQYEMCKANASLVETSENATCPEELMTCQGEIQKLSNNFWDVKGENDDLTIASRDCQRELSHANIVVSDLEKKINSRERAGVNCTGRERVLLRHRNRLMAAVEELMANNTYLRQKNEALDKSLRSMQLPPPPPSPSSSPIEDSAILDGEQDWPTQYEEYEQYSEQQRSPKFDWFDDVDLKEELQRGENTPEEENWWF